MAQKLTKEEWAEAIETSFRFPCRILIQLARNNDGGFALQMTQLTGAQAKKQLENLKFKELGYISLSGDVFTPLSVKDYRDGRYLYDEVERLNDVWVKPKEVVAND